MQARYSPRSCTGFFTDPVSGRPVRVDLGFVQVRVPLVFRVASLTVATPNAFEGFEGATPKAFAVTVTENSRQNASGSYVTPGQSAMDRIPC